jgi:glycosyltransferase involved in cell wall biosynthesis
VENLIYFIALGFPPLGRGNALTNACIVNYLSNYFHIKVITTKEKQFSFLPYKVDYSLFEEITKNTEIERVEALRWGGFENILYYLNLIPCPHLNWFLGVIKKRKKIFTKEGIIFAVYPVLSDLLVGIAIKKMFNFPLIIDFRDDYLGVAQNNMNFIGKVVAKKLERKFIKHADYITVTTEHLKKTLLKRYDLKEENILTVYNVVRNSNAILDKVKIRSEKHEKSTFSVVYAGTISKSQGCEVICKAYKKLISSHPELVDKLKIEIYAPENRYFKKVFKPEMIKGINYNGFIPHSNLLEKLYKADIGFLSLTDSIYSYATPTKLFEFIDLEVPILACLPKGEAKDIIEKNNIGKVSSPNDIDGLAENLYFFYKKKEERKKIKENIKKIKDKYSLSSQGLKWVKIINKLKGGNSFEN